MPLIQCRALGPLLVTIDGAPAPRELHWRKNLALLLYLLRAPRRTAGREHLVGLLWGDDETDKARHSLTEALRHLRRAGQDDIEASSEQVTLGPSFSLDIDRFEAAVARQGWAEAAGLVQGVFAESFSVPSAPEFEDWLDAERRVWRGRSVDALVRYADDLMTGGAVLDALEVVRRAATIDPDSGRAVVAVMRCYLLHREPSAALEWGQLYMARRQELGGEVPAELVRLLHLASDVTATGRDAPIVTRAAPAPFIGRTAELGRLVDAWHACRRDRGTLLALVEGDPGSGVSRLLEECAARARLDGGRVIGMRAVHADQDASESLIGGLAVGGLLGLPGIAASPPAALAAFAKRFAPWADRYGSAGGAEAIDIAEALTAVLQASAEEGPLLILVDDAQRLDPASMRLLAQLQRALAGFPVLVLVGSVGYANDIEMDVLRRLVASQVPALQVSVGPLDTTSLRQLAAQYFPDYDEAELSRLVRRVAADSAGLPLLAVELLRAVQQGLELAGESGSWPRTERTLDQALPGDLPESLVSAVRLNMRRLNRDASAMLATAAMAPEPVGGKLLAKVAELDQRAVEQALDELERHRWLAFDGRGYSFVARLIRPIAVDFLLTPGARHRLRERLTALADE